MCRNVYGNKKVTVQKLFLFKKKRIQEAKKSACAFEADTRIHFYVEVKLRFFVFIPLMMPISTARNQRSF